MGIRLKERVLPPGDDGGDGDRLLLHSGKSSLQEERVFTIRLPTFDSSGISFITSKQLSKK